MVLTDISIGLEYVLKTLNGDIKVKYLNKWSYGNL